MVAHILINCYVALIQDHNTWRHDNVLTVIHRHLVGIVRNGKGSFQNYVVKKSRIFTPLCGQPWTFCYLPSITVDKRGYLAPKKTSPKFQFLRETVKIFRLWHVPWTSVDISPPRTVDHIQQHDGQNRHREKLSIFALPRTGVGQSTIPLGDLFTYLGEQTTRRNSESAHSRPS